MTDLDIGNIKRFWHTLRFLKPVQIYRRIWFHLYQPRVKKGLQQLRIRNGNYAKWQIPPTSGGIWCFEDENIHFSALNEKADLSPFFWNDLKASYIQLYHRHYFEEMKKGASGKWSYLTHLWVAENPVGVKPGWEPYPLSLRAVNWISWHFQKKELSTIAFTSLAEQIRFLQKRFEFHLQGNHLFVNGKASVFAGCFFEGNEADKWLQTGLKLVREELKEQILPDGMNYEMSPMYHALFTIDLLDLINLTNVYPERIPSEDADSWRSQAEGMLRALSVLTHPDGTFALFGDTAKGGTPAYAAILEYANNLEIQPEPLAGPVNLLPVSKYVRTDFKGITLILKAGDLGPDHLLAHAHADSLTFELSYRGKRLIVDTGIDRYGSDTERLKQRSTEVHNTIKIDENNSSEVWSGFRVARRAHALPLKVDQSKDSIHIECGHDGYYRLKDPVIHKRYFNLQDNVVEIIDEIQANAKHILFWNLHTLRPMTISINGHQLKPIDHILHDDFGSRLNGYKYQKKLEATGSTKLICRLKLGK